MTVMSRRLAEGAWSMPAWANLGASAKQFGSALSSTIASGRAVAMKMEHQLEAALVKVAGSADDADAVRLVEAAYTGRGYGGARRATNASATFQSSLLIVLLTEQLYAIQGGCSPSAFQPRGSLATWGEGFGEVSANPDDPKLRLFLANLDSWTSALPRLKEGLEKPDAIASAVTSMLTAKPPSDTVDPRMTVYCTEYTPAQAKTNADIATAIRVKEEVLSAGEIVLVVVANILRIARGLNVLTALHLQTDGPVIFSPTTGELSTLLDVPSADKSGETMSARR